MHIMSIVSISSPESLAYTQAVETRAVEIRAVETRAVRMTV
jgi:hypothetical protein